MNKNILTVVGITILFLGLAVAPLTQGIVTEKSSHAIYDDSTLYVEGRGKPDLIVTNIWFEWNPWMFSYPFFHWIGVTIKNIGDEKVDENEDVNISIIVKKWLFVRLDTYDITIKGGL